MPTLEPIIDPATVDYDAVVADIEQIRRCLPQRHDMEQLTAILRDDPDEGVVVGYKEVSNDEFWIPGHMPGMPLMPGVMMCEAAAQVCSYHVMANRLMEAEMLGFGGLDAVRFRGPVRPGDRLLVAAQRLQLRPKAMIRCRFQCFVDASIVCEGEMRGIPIPVDALRAGG